MQLVYTWRPMEATPSARLAGSMGASAPGQVSKMLQESALLPKQCRSCKCKNDLVWLTVVILVVAMAFVGSGAGVYAGG